MRRTIAALLSCAALAACAGASPVSPSCIGAFVRIDGADLYSHGSAEQADLGALYATVTEDRGCEDVFASVEGQPPATYKEWQDGQASGFAAGTPLHRYNGYPATERLIAVTEHGLVELRKTLPGE